MRITFFVMFVFGVIKCTYSQYLTIGSNRKTSKSSTCDPSAKSSLVEHFFNIIFTEFHTTPPVCVCVQMCPEQPTYCYPNGCLRRNDKNTNNNNSKKAEVPLPVTRVSENAKPIFFIDEKNDFMNDFLTKNYIDENIPIVASIPPPSENVMTTNMRPDPFKDRYKILFKYKKMPKVELKYNLGEQVKNMKSEVLNMKADNNVDVSKTRWPMNKIDRRLGGQSRPIQNEPHVQKGTTNPRYFMTMFPDKDIANYPPKYFKRELPNNTNEEDGVDIKAIYVVGKSESENSAFSLEKLIDSLIESSFDNNTTSDAQNKSTVVGSEELGKAKESSIKRSMKNESTNIISMNLTNENVDKNKYSDDYMLLNNSNNVNEMIATLSKRIDKQNNTSLEMMRRITGEFDFESTNSTSERPIETSLHSEAPTIEYTTLPFDSETRTTRKSRQRLIRRLQHSKNN